MNLSHRLLPAAFALTLGLALLGSNAQAQTSVCGLQNGNYSLVLSTPAACASVSNSTVQGLVNEISTSGVQGLIGSYNGTQVLSATVNYDTTLMSFGYRNAGYTGTGAQLNLSIPALGINQTFNGANRDVTRQELVNYLKQNLAGAIMKYQAGHSPISPIAGVGGLLQNAVAGDFNGTFNDTVEQTAPGDLVNQDSGGKSGGDLIGVGLSASSFITGGQRVNETTLPFSYTIRNDIDPRRQLVFALPVTYVEANQAKSYQGGLGAMYRFPVSDNWTVAPGLRVSGVASPDLASDAGMYALSLMSVYVWNLAHVDIAMGNMIGYDRTLNLHVGGYRSNPDIANEVLRNGLMLSQKVVLGGRRMSLETSLIDTRYFGTKLYVEDTQELGVSLGTNRSASSARSYLRGGITLLHGKDTKGINGIIGYWF